jgi:putative ABC transport system substrate-binding protein
MDLRERRRFVVAAATALLAAPRVGFPQQGPKVWRVGYLQGTPYLDAFTEGMRELGYEVGRNLVIESRTAGGDYRRLPAVAAELVNRNLDVIVVTSTPAAAALKGATSTVPVVMSIVGDPVKSGFISSLARPGGNFTGFSLANPDISLKWFELARTLAPRSQIGVLADSNQSTVPWYVKDIERAAQKLGIRVPVAYARTANNIESALDSLAQQSIATVVMLPSLMFDNEAARMAQSAVERRIALIASARSWAEKGSLLSYGQNYAAFARRAATYVDKILKGAKPSELPVEQPMILELTINLTTARRLGLTISQELLLRADKLFE